MGIFSKRPKHEIATGVDLSQVIRGMQHAVNEAQRTLETHHLKSLLRFFYADGEPKSVDLHLGGTKHIDIPLVTLANHSSLKIEELEMEFKARIENVRVEEPEEIQDIVENSGETNREASASDKMSDSWSQNGNAAFSIGFSPTEKDGEQTNTVTVRIKFSSANQPEGLSRIIDEYNKLVAPYDVHPPASEEDSPAFVFDDTEDDTSAKDENGEAPHI